MKKSFSLLLLCLLSSILYSQSNIPEKFTSAIEFLTPYIDKIEPKPNINRIQITEADWLNFQFEKLEEFDQDFDYSVYGLITVNNIKLLMVERRYSEESNHWIVLMNDNNKILESLNIAYDNSEGFLYLESEISSDQILIKEDNTYADPNHSEKIYTATNLGFQKK